MKFMQALRESAKGCNIISYTGAVYTPEMLNARCIGEHAAVCDALITEFERKGEWRNDLD
jgi:hypothetical protein